MPNVWISKSANIHHTATIIEKNSIIYPLTMVRGEIGNNKIVKSMDNIVTKEKEKVLCKYI